ncbi:MAG: gluconate 2-dehydrogenase subunit 3 family protein [Hyphomonadaceae bacterium]|nr:gluconate 2-dehydrogenase subunit 3 family protein [Hyphomonadaceae bacterium]
MSEQKFTRRIFLSGALLTVTALSLTGCADSQTQLVKMEQAGAFFNPEDLTLLNDIAEIMIPRTDTPGAMDAQVAAVIDAMMMTWANGPTRDLFSNTLQKIELMAETMTGKPYSSLTLKQRQSLISEIDVTAFSDEVPDYAEGYKRLKDLIFRVFYSSEAANADYVPIPGQYRGNLTLGEYESLMEAYSYGG